MIKAQFTISELKTIITCLRGYRISGSETLADKIANAMKKKGLI